jgi:hypothetical protein
MRGVDKAILAFIWIPGGEALPSHLDQQFGAQLFDAQPFQLGLCCSTFGGEFKLKPFQGKKFTVSWYLSIKFSKLKTGNFDSPSLGLDF